MDAISKIKESLESGKLIIGTKTVRDNLKAGKIASVYATVNCPQSTVSDLEHYAKLSGSELEKLSIPNDELGIICKKPFSISVVAVLK